MDRQINRPDNRSAKELAEAKALRRVIADALGATRVDEQPLRRGVWTYVGLERQAGTSPGCVIMELTEMVDAARIAPASARQALMTRAHSWPALQGALPCYVR